MGEAALPLTQARLPWWRPGFRIAGQAIHRALRSGFPVFRCSGDAVCNLIRGQALSGVVNVSQ